MTKDKLVNLTKYQATLKDRLLAPLPPKHAGHEASYRQFLTRELEIVTKQLDAAKLEGSVK